MPPNMMPQTPNQQTPQTPNLESPNPLAQVPSFGGTTFGADIGSNVALSPGGYLDVAIPKSNLRIRFDQGFDMNRPDRAEFFYAAWREIQFHPHGIGGGASSIQNVQGRGLDPLPADLNYQEVSAALELAAGRRWSAFIEVPFRMLQMSNLFSDEGAHPGDEPQIPGDPHEALELFGTNFGGLSDIVLGGKAAIIAEPDRYWTVQLRAFFPSGNSRFGLGTGHYSMEPGLLFYRRYAENWTVQGQFKAWIPIAGTTANITDANGNVTSTSFAGNVLIYGLGIGYDLIQRDNFRLTPVAEFVGWTVLNGFESLSGTNFDALNPNVPANHGVADSGGVTIINGKIGFRAYLGANDDFYFGVGQALTTNRWYNEILRVEYRRSW